MSERQKATIAREIEVERIPDEPVEWSCWEAWCEERDIYPMNSGRRGWVGTASTYIRAAQYLIWEGDVITDCVMAEEITITQEK